MTRDRLDGRHWDTRRPHGTCARCELPMPLQVCWSKDRGFYVGRRCQMHGKHGRVTVYVPTLETAKEMLADLTDTQHPITKKEVIRV